MKTVVTVTGIRPDFVRMCEVFKRLDERFQHILIHSGQHYDRMLSEVFFEELNIREPDIHLRTGAPGRRHYEQTAEVSVNLIEALNSLPNRPDIVLYLGDSNSVVSSIAVKKEGYRVGHIEAGMRSGDWRMLEEVNRVTCDAISDILFVYHRDYANNLYAENTRGSVNIVGNTIVEPCMVHGANVWQEPKTRRFILLDIHRPENFQSRQRMENIIGLANFLGHEAMLPVRMLAFGRTMTAIDRMGLKLGSIQPEPLMSYQQFLQAQYDAYAIISDSGTAQEEPSLLNTPVLVPRDYTERPQSVSHDCSRMVDVNAPQDVTWEKAVDFVHDIDSGTLHMDTSWLGVGRTSHAIAEILSTMLGGV